MLFAIWILNMLHSPIQIDEVFYNKRKQNLINLMIISKELQYPQLVVFLVMPGSIIKTSRKTPTNLQQNNTSCVKLNTPVNKYLWVYDFKYQLSLSS